MPSSKVIIVAILHFFSLVAFGQGNPGFLGKKVAIGYSTQYCVSQSEEIGYRQNNLFQVLTNHEVYFEHSLNKYRSFSGHISYQKVPYEQLNSNRYFFENYTLNGTTYRVNYEANGGISDFHSLGLGGKFNFYLRKKTVSAPVGISHYFRLDLIINNAINNNYKYRILNTDALSDSQEKHALKSIDREVKDVKSYGFSAGYGIEAKILLSRSLFLRFNSELNISQALLIENNSLDSVTSIDQDFFETCQIINGMRNVFLIGLGAGFLL